MNPGDFKKAMQEALNTQRGGLLGSIRDDGRGSILPQAVGRGPSTPRVYTYQNKMEMRMGWQPGHVPSVFAFVEYRMVGDKAFMWILTNDGQSIVLEDDAALFPSDVLITKVRLMEG